MKQKGKKVNLPHRYSGKGRPAAEDSAYTRAAILDSAIRLFAKRGVSGTTMADISEDVGVTQAMIYYYFKTREGLLDAIVNESIGPMLEYVWNVDNLENPEDIFTRMITRLREMVEKLPAFPQLWSKEIFPIGGALRERVMGRILRDRGMPLFDALKKAARNGLIGKNLEPGLLPLTTMGAFLLALAGTDFIDREPEARHAQIQRASRHALEIVLCGYRGKGE